MYTILVTMTKGMEIVMKLISKMFQKHLDFCFNNVYNEYTN
ncbi:hypothetical protein MelnitzEXVC044M_220 [Methylophilales phage Melnitz EXVC044M]|nr:polypeptide deformylase [Methylophilales phage Melnitz-1 EXVC043M]QZI94724.1 hypothetical protein Melnitz2EXVC040M_220 [Methylophilales phage Melnitz-2 EXVC040M]QZI94946.1 hypothetical protein MelnitzEXVC044M_220 [Methylophilales phage Melnitz EXVC044M]QZI95167.1 hypothetical protein Melnitz3EXVC039M_220 [Methylophilales phage Melnitz-3 EXVC039M]